MKKKFETIFLKKKKFEKKLKKKVENKIEKNLKKIKKKNLKKFFFLRKINLKKNIEEKKI